MSTYRKLAIALVSIVVWFSTITTSFADVNTNVVASSEQLQAPIQVLAFVDSDDTNSARSKLYDDIEQAWKQRNVKDSLFAVCDATTLDRDLCRDLLKTEIVHKRQSLLDSCYSTPGTNGRLCLALAVKNLGLNSLVDLDRWINELDEPS
ncbi:hypothetical protein G7B40_031805 [Aetokthonos hydrillicola Thurmond2011]|jgi:hypothetical protein|uniref:Secreted protein n=1 Tax=Aetokthonos hydrillicola Thurmond2011 TaxID=2712845 RepID=A0AAP5IG58_9CYAN|nr:hypothetical protein [Aetokthonos hydrillicola]MBO3461279.1 hypothetical protein [Aetokthonos hydrillicola CCALA 1050]MBW4589618.1 hypothetical protein [Aetokthonos hydrillicola CCALA 1050]MDR9899113.1 hypothetical protein [Aetokthonos hydrillicola Thurmond2011]